MSGEIEQRLAQLAQRVAGRKLPVKEQANTFEAFREDFNSFKEKVLNPAVEKINVALNSSGSVVDVVTSNPDSSRFFTAQLIFHDATRPGNLLSDPYVLVEGYPQSGEVRIVEGDSAEPGSRLSISNLEDPTEYENQVLETLSSLIENQVTS